MLRKTCRFLAFVLLSLLLATAAYADTGPHYSVEIRLELPAERQPCYATLLSEKQRNGPYSAVEPGSEEKGNGTELSARAYDLMSRYRDPDGFFFMGEVFSCEDGGFRWGYFPPDTFKVLLCFPQTGELICGETLERFTFDTVYRGTLAGGSLTFEKEWNIGGWLLGFVCRLAVTLILELGLALLFRYRLLPVLFINVLTQIGLNLLLAVYAHYRGGGGFDYFLLYLFAEAAVLVVEWNYYCGKLRKTNAEKPGKGILFIYALLANALSFSAGVALNVLWHI